jgi:hypothetical protein
VFRVVQATKLAPDAIEESKPENGGKRNEPAAERAEPVKSEPVEKKISNESRKMAEPPARAPETPVAPVALPTGPELLEKIRPLMRRNRRGPGGSGSGSFLARALKCSEADLVTAFGGLGLVVPATPADPAIEREIAGDIWWLNRDSRGGLWINGREKREGETVSAAATPAASSDLASSENAPAPAESATAGSEPLPSLPIQSAGEPTSDPARTADSVLAAVRLLLKETKTGSFAGKSDRVAEELGKSTDDLVAALVAAGLKVPEKAREKPVFVEHAGEIFWFNRNAKGELWLNAKASKYADKPEAGDQTGNAEEGAKKPARRGGGRSKKATEGSAEPAP